MGKDVSNAFNGLESNANSKRQEVLSGFNMASVITVAFPRQHGRLAMKGLRMPGMKTIRQTLWTIDISAIS